MVIRAVVFDIGGVLEIDPDLGVIPMWEDRLGLPAGERPPGGSAARRSPSSAASWPASCRACSATTPGR